MIIYVLFICSKIMFIMFEINIPSQQRPFMIFRTKKQAKCKFW